jgi:hypothetical protein
MLETASEMRCRGPDANFAVEGGFDGVSVGEEPFSGEFGGEIARCGCQLNPCKCGKSAIVKGLTKTA